MYMYIHQNIPVHPHTHMQKHITYNYVQSATPTSKQIYQWLMTLLNYSVKIIMVECMYICKKSKFTTNIRVRYTGSSLMHLPLHHMEKLIFSISVSVNTFYDVTIMGRPSSKTFLQAHSLLKWGTTLSLLLVFCSINKQSSIFSDITVRGTCFLQVESISTEGHYDWAWHSFLLSTSQWENRPIEDVLLQHMYPTSCPFTGC